MVVQGYSYNLLNIIREIIKNKSGHFFQSKCVLMAPYSTELSKVYHEKNLLTALIVK